MIEIKHLNKSFGNHSVINDLNLELPDCGLVSIVGPSGCGKTTLLNVLSCIDCDAQGEVILMESIY